MNDLMRLVTPLTRAVIWIVKDECGSTNPHYSEVDYLLDGLLTANLKANEKLSSRVFIGQNFNKPLFVFIIKEVVSSEISSFVTLIQNDLGPENDILVIDEADSFSKIKNEFKTVSANIKLIT